MIILLFSYRYVCFVDLYIKYLFEVAPGVAVVGYAVASGVGGIVGHLLAAVEFALGRVDGVGMGRRYTCVGVFVYLFTTDIFPTKHAGLGVALAVESYASEPL